MRPRSITFGEIAAGAVLGVLVAIAIFQIFRT